MSDDFDWRDYRMTLFGAPERILADLTSEEFLDLRRNPLLPEIRDNWERTSEELKELYNAVAGRIRFENANQSAGPAVSSPEPITMRQSSRTIPAPLSSGRSQVRKIESVLPVELRVAPPLTPLMSERAEPPEQLSASPKDELPNTSEKLGYYRAPLEEIISRDRYGVVGVHPAAELMPLAADQEFQGMCRDIKARGSTAMIVYLMAGLGSRWPGRLGWI